MRRARARARVAWGGPKPGARARTSRPLWATNCERYLTLLDTLSPAPCARISQSERTRRARIGLSEKINRRFRRAFTSRALRAPRSAPTQSHRPRGPRRGAVRRRGRARREEPGRFLAARGARHTPRARHTPCASSNRVHVSPHRRAAGHVSRHPGKPNVKPHASERVTWKLTAHGAHVPHPESVLCTSDEPAPAAETPAVRSPRNPMRRAPNAREHARAPLGNRGKMRIELLSARSGAEAETRVETDGSRAPAIRNNRQFRSQKI